ncbi:hypothetical protein M4R22_08530 [Acidovorax sp. GBBC 3334]|uniref:hypothetical protein n=1 Tax=Acidovorax sp. GBBC 3334 TaxID=2940496 RepID=UPI00230299FE|nr:hypothetical protein [Acidovorax sp. GBBC 3334]MDA8454806.1 hypothetical protein [Acidovorax sp. GBBC 3334]
MPSITPLHDARTGHPGTSTASHLSLRPGEKVLFCLAPGGSLTVERGRLALRGGPTVWGQVMVSQAELGSLEAGQCRVGLEGAPAEWMELCNPGTETAHAVLLEPVPVLSQLGVRVAEFLHTLADAGRILSGAARALFQMARLRAATRHSVHGPETTTAP